MQKPTVMELTEPTVPAPAQTAPIGSMEPLSCLTLQRSEQIAVWNLSLSLPHSVLTDRHDEAYKDNDHDGDLLLTCSKHCVKYTGFLHASLVCTGAVVAATWNGDLFFQGNNPESGVI